MLLNQAKHFLQTPLKEDGQESIIILLMSYGGKKMIKSAVEALKQVGSSFKLEPFATIIQPIIEDVLAEHKKDKYRKGTILTPNLDFHRWVTVMFDGTSMTMPDTESNRDKFGKPKSNKGSGAFPQMRAVALLVMSARLVFDVAYAPFKGKKTGERTLMLQILKTIKRKDFLFLFDAGFYSFFSSLVYERKGT